MMRKIFEASPIPNQITATVIIATDGMNRRNSVYGSRTLRAGRNEPITSPIGMPSSEPARNPARIRWMLADRCSNSTPLRMSTMAFRYTTTGGGKRTEPTTKTAATCQITTRLTNPSTYPP